MVKFEGFCICCTCHTRKLVIQAEVILEGNWRKGLVFVLNTNPFFRFYSLVQTFRPATAFHRTTRMLVNNNDLVFFNDVVYVFSKQLVCTKRSVNMMKQWNITCSKQRLAFRQHALLLKNFLNVNLTALGKMNLFCLKVNRVVTIALLAFFILFFLLNKFRNNGVDAAIQLWAIFGLTRNNKWCTGFVDKNWVNFVHYGVV